MLVTTIHGISSHQVRRSRSPCLCGYVGCPALTDLLSSSSERCLLAASDSASVPTCCCPAAGLVVLSDEMAASWTAGLPESLLPNLVRA